MDFTPAMGACLSKGLPEAAGSGFGLSATGAEPSSVSSTAFISGTRSSTCRSTVSFRVWVEKAHPWHAPIMRT